MCPGAMYGRVLGSPAAGSLAMLHEQRLGKLALKRVATCPILWAAADAAPASPLASTTPKAAADSPDAARVIAAHHADVLQQFSLAPLRVPDHSTASSTQATPSPNDGGGSSVIPPAITTTSPLSFSSTCGSSTPTPKRPHAVCRLAMATPRTPAAPAAAPAGAPTVVVGQQEISSGVARRSLGQRLAAAERESVARRRALAAAARQAVRTFHIWWARQGEHVRRDLLLEPA